MGLVNNTWSWLRSPSARWPVGLLLIGGFISGAIFFIVFHFTMAYSNSMDLCISCHEMDGVYEEYKKSTHYSNPSGVRATCADCHVPHDKNFFGWVEKFVFKVEIGGKDIYHHLMGTYPTRESFEKVRWELANRTWDDIKKRDAKECKFCHNYAAMDLSAQDRTGAKKHTRAAEEGKNCIECHKGVAHKVPAEPEESAKK